MSAKKRYYIGVGASFSSAHQLRGHSGPCKDLHGHNWRVEAAFAAGKLDRAGMVVDFYHVKEQLNRLVAMLDHKVLNEVPPFDKWEPTAERIAEFFFKELKKGLKVSPTRVTVFETDSTWSAYGE